MGVAAAAVAPAIRDTEADTPVFQSATEVARLLRSARRTALERGVPVTVTVIPGSALYLVETEDESVDVLARGALALVPGTTIVPQRRRSRFMFWPAGGAEPDSLRITGQSGSATVLVDQWSGEVRIRAPGT